MPRTSPITFDDFNAVAQEIKEAGQRLTFAAVRAKLGGGSYEVIRRYLDQLEKQEKTQISAVATVPSNLVGSMQAWYAQARDEARAIAQAELSTEVESFRKEQSTFAQERENLQIQAATDRAIAQECKERIDALLQERDTFKMALKNKETKFSELKNQVKQLQQEMLQKIESHGGELANAHAQARDAANRLLLMTDQLRELVKNSLQTQTVFAGFLKEFSEVSEFGKRLEQKIESRIDESKAQTIAYEITQTKIINGINYLKEEMQKIPASKKLRNMHDRRRRMA